jgi:glycosyltransferase involved in cell wall biosynthesis
MHLAIVTPYPPAITGIGQYGYHTSRALAASGAFARVSILAGSDQNGHAPPETGLSRVESCWLPGQLDARQRILSRLGSLAPDLVWFNMGVSVFGGSPWANLAGLSAPAAAGRMGLPTVVTLHELIELTNLRALRAPGGPFSAWGARLLTRVATRGDVVCVTMRRYARWLAPRLEGRRVIHIPIGAYYPPEILPAGDAPEILFFSTLAPFKGLEVLLQAFSALKAEIPALQLSIAGVEHIRFPHYVDGLKAAYAQRSGINWLGQVPEERLRETFQRAQLVALPAQASTGSSSVLMQAATWGRAVVASDLPENRQFAAEMGFDLGYFETGNAVSLADALRRGLADADWRQAQAAQNFAAIGRVRLEIVSRAYLDAFNHALAARQSAKRIPVPAAPQLDFSRG